ncbi:hypothetical protein [Microcoleus sp. D3_18_C4]|uniref:hypothetical protein n=1 Tax=Microcoleus sp. D3_18_C4 TaxID=3055335 RepID=UPI002FD59B38
MNIPPNQSNNPVFERQSWFSNRKALEYIRYCLKAARQDIRIASGFFTIRGWGLIRQ